MKTKELKLESDQADEMSADDAEVVVGLIARWILARLTQPDEKLMDSGRSNGRRVKELP
jgi:hypothetical protein